MTAEKVLGSHVGYVRVAPHSPGQVVAEGQREVPACRGRECSAQGDAGGVEKASSLVEMAAAEGA